MKIENPAAFNFIFQDDVYLLSKDKANFVTTEKTVTAAVEETVTEAALVIETPKLSFNYLGQHKKKFLILAHYPGIEFMDAPHLAALESTLTRLGYVREDVAILNLASYPGALFEQLDGYFSPQLLLILGKQAIPPEMEALPFNKPVKIKQTGALFTFSFNELMNSNENKKAFWEQMKQL